MPTDVLEEASWVAAIAELRGYLMRYAPGLYSPEMTDDETVEVLWEMFRKLKPIFERAVALLDENLPDWREGAWQA